MRGELVEQAHQCRIFKTANRLQLWITAIFYFKLAKTIHHLPKKRLLFKNRHLNFILFLTTFIHVINFFFFFFCETRQSDILDIVPAGWAPVLYQSQHGLEEKLGNQVK